MDRTGAAVHPLDDRQASAVGRHARLELVFAVRRGRTILAHGYAEPPLRVGRCLDTDRGVHLILASSAPGIFGGDCFEHQIMVESGAVVMLTSQSSLQVHASPACQPALVRSRFAVSDGAELSCEWHPTVPFADSRLDQRIDLQVADGGCLFWSDAVMAGRLGHGERWQFRGFDHELRLSREGRLVYLERQQIRLDAEHRATRDVAYFGTALGVGASGAAVRAEQIHQMLAAIDQLKGSADALEADLVLVRMLAESGVPFHSARRLIAGLTQG